MTKKIKIGVIGAIVSLFLFLILIIIIIEKKDESTTHDNEPKNEQTELAPNTEPKEDNLESLSIENKTPTIKDKEDIEVLNGNQAVGGERVEEYVAKGIETEARTMLRQGSFDKAINFMTEKIPGKIERTVESEKMYRLYDDLFLAQNLLSNLAYNGQEENEFTLDQSGIENLLKGFSDPEALLTTVMEMPFYWRFLALNDVRSLNPVTDEKIIFTKETFYKEHPYLKEIQLTNKNAKSLYILDFDLEGNSYLGYIIRLNDGTLKFEKVEVKEGHQTYFESVAFWLEKIKEGKMKPPFRLIGYW